ncbi:hypothetical protein MNBD_NITROSPIRAE01-1527 [hydrothermal vent metagenome]|uniref:Uncharacterized protein n=1 Tax=hydrothermal vent metagenome TaxID=652676 RepID=A0A3B1D312_9ZZZZ
MFDEKLNLKESLLIFFIVSFVLLLSIPVAKADGLAVEEAKTTATAPPLGAVPPPLVEAEGDLFLPPEPEEVVAEIPEPPKEDLWPLVSQGMIIRKLGHTGIITASEDEKQMLAQGDLIYLATHDESFFPDQEWVVFETIKDVIHPKTQTPMGELVHVLGLVKVIDVAEDVATARITRSHAPMKIGNPITFIESFIPLSTEKGLPPEKGSEAFVIEVKDARMNNAQHDVVYIDRGKKAGIARGDRFVIVHEGKRKSFSETVLEDNTLPYRKVGIMVVLATQADTATAKIIQSIEPIAKGDTVLFDSSEE